jgi:hypothetical protein
MRRNDIVAVENVRRGCDEVSRRESRHCQMLVEGSAIRSNTECGAPIVRTP